VYAREASARNLSKESNGFVNACACKYNIVSVFVKVCRCLYVCQCV